MYPNIAGLCAMDTEVPNRFPTTGLSPVHWESGMDASSRFLVQQPTGGELIDFVRVAEIQAAMAHAAHSIAKLCGNAWAPRRGYGSMLGAGR